MAAEHGPTAGEYIIHHLTHLQNAKPKAVVDFSVFSFDSLFFSIVLGIVTCFLLWKAARKASSGVPGRMQAAVEFLVEMVDSQAKGIVHNAESRKTVAPLALTVFIWVFLMNAMDLLPLDLLPKVGEAAGVHYMRVVPTADLSVTMALSVSVLLICIFYNLKIKGAGGWLHELFTAPFGNHFLLYPFNFLMQMIEFVAKTVSHGMRLFGNMYAGELVFMLIALLGASVFTWTVGSTVSFFGQLLAGAGWAIFHILIITLQAYIFMVLTVVYAAMATEHH